MSLKIGTKAPDFTLPSTQGSFTLSKDCAGKACVLYFYPKDFTTVCTKEACSFGAEFSRFQNMEIDIFGISRDTIETHQKFKETYNLPFELLSDLKGEVAKKYKANIPFIGLTKRVTYLLDKDHVIVGVYSHMLQDQEHVNIMLERAKTLC